MQAYVDSGPHLGISARLDHFCDEATFVDWEQASADLPDWQTSWRHLTADGKAAANQTRDFPARPAASQRLLTQPARADERVRFRSSGPPAGDARRAPRSVRINALPW
jgi:hypothetical protein